MTIRGVVEPSGAAMWQGRGADGRWERWRVAVRLRPWRGPDGSVSSRPLYLWRPTLLPLWLWRLCFPAGAVVAVRVERDLGGERARLLGWLGPRRDPALDRALTAWRAAQELEDARFGRFTHDLRTGMLEAETPWLGDPVCLTLDSEAGSDAPLRTAKALFDDAAHWDARVREAIVADLLPLKNENWLDAGEAPLTAEAFLAPIRLSSIVVGAERFVQFYFYDGNLFWGHSIVVTRDGDRLEAEIAG
jgi:hypothetical protein